MKSLNKKLLEFKKEVGAISKDSKNPFYKSKYFDINKLIQHVEPILLDKGLIITQPIQDGKVVTVIRDVDSDCYIYSEIALPNIADPQKLGSCITYYRRYTLTSLLGLQAEDDDGNKASKEVNKPIEKQKLTKEGYDYLIKNKNKEHILKALVERNITDEWKLNLKSILVDEN